MPILLLVDLLRFPRFVIHSILLRSSDAPHLFRDRCTIADVSCFESCLGGEGVLLRELHLTFNIKHASPSPVPGRRLDLPACQQQLCSKRILSEGYNKVWPKSFTACCAMGVGVGCWDICEGNNFWRGHVFGTRSCASLRPQLNSSRLHDLD